MFYMSYSTVPLYYDTNQSAILMELRDGFSFIQIIGSIVYPSVNTGICCHWYIHSRLSNYDLFFPGRVIIT